MQQLNALTHSKCSKYIIIDTRTNDKKLAKDYTKYELQRLSKRIDRKRDIGAGRHFKMDLRDRFVMLLAKCGYYLQMKRSIFHSDNSYSK